uniref:Ig-like domain-containing protein n=1 Tax=Chelonoidis abingdonii TaxID=106734 RepID=A0A8C0GH53_CHEAB
LARMQSLTHVPNVITLNPHLFSFHFLTGWAIRQPPDMVVILGKPLTLNCSLSETTQLMTIYWYKQAMGKDARLQLVMFSTEGSSANVEKPFEGHFQSNGTKNYVLSLYAESAQMQDSGTYYCAKQDHTVTQLPKALSINLPAKGKNFPSPTPMHSPASCIRCTPFCSNTSLPIPMYPPLPSLTSLLLSLCAICLTRWWERVCCCRG